MRGAWSPVDSPPDQSATLRQLDAIERELRAADRLGFDAPARLAALGEQLWTLLLDVVCSPLWVRLRAAALLNVCFAVREEALRVTPQNAYRVRSIVSSTCQVLEELDATERRDEDALFAWLEFLEHVLLTTPSEVFAKVLRHSMYIGMLTKMLRLLSSCSTKVFAATAMCIAAFYAHELQCKRGSGGRSHHAVPPSGEQVVLVDQVLAAHREGMEHFGGALLHVINSCGYPCAESRLVHLRNALQLLGDILGHAQASQLVFVNDFKVLLDIFIRECADRPLEDMTRLHFLVLLDRALGSALFLQSHMYRKAEILRVLEDLLDAAGAARRAGDGDGDDDSELPPEVVAQANQLLLRHIDGVSCVPAPSSTTSKTNSVALGSFLTRVLEINNPASKPGPSPSRLETAALQVFAISTGGARSVFFVHFCSALPYSRTLRTLRLHGDDDGDR
ncbi:hypothetical protein PybrP1_010745 [[Pythium] brassicae (nom. inval.)]|nr:hypothetical protein PybrP1_010745 [[Pythium] brassicae (nom. inval.)]